MAIFAVELTFKPDRNDERLAVRPLHREYLATLRDQGKLVTAGPFADDSGSMLIYDVADEQELRTILEADPYTPAGVAEVAHAREWKLLFPVGGSAA